MNNSRSKYPWKSSSSQMYQTVYVSDYGPSLNDLKHMDIRACHLVLVHLHFAGYIY